MTTKDPKDDLLEDDELATTGAVKIAQQDGEQLGQECSAASTRVKRKFEAVRRKISGTYSQVRPPPDRGSRP